MSDLRDSLSVEVTNFPQVEGMSKRDFMAFELAKLFIKEGWEAPLTNAVEYTDSLLKKLEKSKELDNG